MLIIKEQNVLFIKKSEGWRNYPYKCTGGKWTIGWGFNLDFVPKFIDDDNLWHEGQELSLSVAEEWLDYLVDQTMVDLKTALPNFETYPDYVQFVLIDMCYNMGVGTFLGFKLMLRAVEDGNMEKMSSEMLNSNWYNQVGYRSSKLIGAITFQDIDEAF